MSEVKTRQQTQFKKGAPAPQSESLTQELREARKINKNTTTKLLNKFLFMDRDELASILTNKKTPLVELMVGKIVEHAIRFGDHKRLDFLLDRLIGPITTQENTLPPPTIIKLIGQDAAIAIGHYQKNQGGSDEEEER